MKIHFPSLRFLASGSLVLLALAVAAPAQSPARLNPYDALSRTLVPLASLFSPQSSQHGLTATLVLESMTDLPPEYAGARVDFALQPPDRALLRGPVGGETATVCRVGQEVWITPGARFHALASSPAGEEAPSEPGKKKKKKKKQKEALGPMVLPFPPQQLALLPVLFLVKDAGERDGLRVLDVRLMPELARGLGIEEWNARLFLDLAGPGPSSAPRLARLELSRPGWSVAVRVERLAFAPELPAATWEPASPDVLRLSGPQVRQWLGWLGDRINASRKGGGR